MTILELRAMLDESEKTGRPIQRQGTWGKWENVSTTANLSWLIKSDFRVAPPEQPKPREFWMIPGRKSDEFLAYQDDSNTPREHWKQAGYTLVREVMEDPK